MVTEWRWGCPIKTSPSEELVSAACESVWNQMKPPHLNRSSAWSRCSRWRRPVWTVLIHYYWNDNIDKEHQNSCLVQHLLKKTMWHADVPLELVFCPDWRTPSFCLMVIKPPFMSRPQIKTGRQIIQQQSIWPWCLQWPHVHKALSGVTQWFYIHVSQPEVWFWRTLCSSQTINITGLHSRNAVYTTIQQRKHLFGLILCSSYFLGILIQDLVLVLVLIRVE